jgi:hypothetical protein
MYWGKNTSWNGLSSGTVGALQELRVSVDLMIRGYEVFRALSPSCSCDLMVLNGNKMLRIEVRTAYENPQTGHLGFPRSRSEKFGMSLTDHYALALSDKIVYRPDLPELGAS